MLCFCRENRGRPAAASAMEPNTLMLFEEAGGDSSQANFQTVTLGNVCANADEGETMGEGAPSTWLGSWKQRRWWRKGSGRGWHELRRWQQSFHCCARYNRVDDGSSRRSREGQRVFCCWKKQNVLFLLRNRDRIEKESTTTSTRGPDIIFE
ncbi:hypothetical protein BHE74_00048695 [Ensete ventricosum]|nr:hypothetical protein GW17_00043328 [Ensete ventricosum]RWW45457.1 hypothetical protein BHE74_00048695 [Ensete ventricosum]RZS20579.1 hypothetical protein BHM03_00053114 [Ensete ventricosum]